MVAPPEPEEPPPPPVKLVLHSPRPNARLKVEAGTKSARVPVDFSWSVTPADMEVVFSLRKGESPEPLASERVKPSPAGKGSYKWVANAPGQYTWELTPAAGDGKNADGKSERASAKFAIEADFEGIEVLEPLVAGEAHVSNQLRERVLKNFDIALRWEPYSGAKKYKVELSSTPGGKVLMTRETEQPSLSLNRDKVFSGEIYYQVSAALPGGFRVHSAATPFRFMFLSPALTLPVDGARLNTGGDSGNAGKVLLTWQKTNFTEKYELQIARDRDFQDLYFEGPNVENFLVLTNLPPGSYFWRVRSISGKVKSAMSAPKMFSVVAPVPSPNRAVSPGGAKQGVLPPTGALVNP